ncbi:MAG TPA: ComEA family DNA-binding protein [Anaerolineae bacterium]|nr:ComEA family DNA-binding protein [Anaerolineae bacterium]
MAMDAWLQKSRGYLVLTLTFAIILGAVVVWRQPAQASIQIVEPTPRPTATPALVVVHVTGAVLRPDVYTLPENSRLKDAVRAAGGLRPDADEEALNLATPLRDGERIRVPALGETPVAMAMDAAVAAAPAAASALYAAGTVNLNTATAQELDSLPGIGAVLAQRIVEDRQANGQYAAVDDLARVRGIGPALLEKLRPLATVR